MSLPSLYSCYVCNNPVNVSSSSVYRKAVVWLKGSGKTVGQVDEELYVYRHEFCSETTAPKQDSLF